MEITSETMTKEMSNTCIIQWSDRELTTANRPAGFLNLPGELRNWVYGLVLLDKHPLYPWFKPSSRHHWRQTLATGLLRASKTVHREASSLFYGQNRFDFAYVSPERIIAFLEKLAATTQAIFDTSSSTSRGSLLCILMILRSTWTALRSSRPSRRVASMCKR